MSTHATTRPKRRVIYAKCQSCGLRLIGEMRNGKLYPSDHPERAEGDEQPVTCSGCAAQETR